MLSRNCPVGAAVQGPNRSNRADEYRAAWRQRNCGPVLLLPDKIAEPNDRIGAEVSGRINYSRNVLNVILTRRRPI